MQKYSPLTYLLMQYVLFRVHSVRPASYVNTFNWRRTKTSASAQRSCEVLIWTRFVRRTTLYEGRSINSRTDSKSHTSDSYVTLQHNFSAVHCNVTIVLQVG